MEYIIRKTYLGLALEEIIQEMDLKEGEAVLWKCLRYAFLEESESTFVNPLPRKILEDQEIEGIELKARESVIGQDKIMCYAALISTDKFNALTNELTIVYAFSDNRRVREGETMKKKKKKKAIKKYDKGKYRYKKQRGQKRTK